MVGKSILILGILLIFVGPAVWLIESLGLPLGRLPGDIQMRGKGRSFHFPIVTCIVVTRRSDGGAEPLALVLSMLEGMPARDRRHIRSEP